MAPRRRDDNSGKYTEVYSESEIIATLSGTRLSTTELAEELDCHRTTAHDRLRELEAEGVVISKEVGNTLLWEITKEKEE